MSLEDEGVVVLFTDTEMAIAEYGNECLTNHKPHKTLPTALDHFNFYIMIPCDLDL